MYVCTFKRYAVMHIINHKAANSSHICSFYYIFHMYSEYKNISLLNNFKYSLLQLIFTKILIKCTYCVSAMVRFSFCRFVMSQITRTHLASSNPDFSKAERKLALSSINVEKQLIESDSAHFLFCAVKLRRSAARTKRNTHL